VPLEKIDRFLATMPDGVRIIKTRVTTSRSADGDPSDVFPDDRFKLAVLDYCCELLRKAGLDPREVPDLRLQLGELVEELLTRIDDKIDELGRRQGRGRPPKYATWRIRELLAQGEKAYRIAPDPALDLDADDDPESVKARRYSAVRALDNSRSIDLPLNPLP